MIVENDPIVAEVNQLYLELMEGFYVKSVVSSANEALQVLEKMDIDLILLDIFMPGMNGLEFLRKLRQIGNSVDVIITTAASDNTTIKKALRFGAVDYIIKPFEFERLNSVLMAYKTLADCNRRARSMKPMELDQGLVPKEQPVSVRLPISVNRNTLHAIWKRNKRFKSRPPATDHV